MRSLLSYGASALCEPEKPRLLARDGAGLPSERRATSCLALLAMACGRRELHFVRGLLVVQAHARVAHVRRLSECPVLFHLGRLAFHAETGLMSVVIEAGRRAIALELE